MNKEKIKMPLSAQVCLFVALLFPAVGAIIYFCTMNGEVGGLFGAAWFWFFFLVWCRILIQ